MWDFIININQSELLSIKTKEFRIRVMLQTQTILQQFYKLLMWPNFY